MMSENKSSSKTEKKRSGSLISTIRTTGANTVTAADDTAIVTAKRRMVLGGGRRGTASTAATTTASTTWEITPIPILVLTFQYLNHPGLMKASTVSKQWYRIIYTNPGMAQHRISPVLSISASKNESDEGRLVRLMEWLVTNLNKLQRYHILQLLDVNKFDDADIDEGFQRFQLDGIVAFDVSSPSKLSSVNCDVLRQLSSMLPNLRVINLSNIGGKGFDEILNRLSTHCPQLESITWNNIHFDCNIDVTGWDMWQAMNLREIIMDGSFLTSSGFGRADIWEQMSDLENHPSIYLFCRWKSQVVERISIRGTKYYDFFRQTRKTVPQNALIKYIRNAPPSLRWFRSDLSKDNIEMLRLERPGIEFLN